MHNRPLGPTGRHVSEIGLGGMPMSISGRPGASDSIRVIHASLDAGVTFIDTADVYCLDDSDIGHNERLIARALREHPDGAGVLVATKGGLARPGGAWVRSGHPDHIAAACEASLRALGTDCIDLYQLHAPDPSVPYADTLGALSRLREAGKVQHIGLSNVSAAQASQAAALFPVASIQNRCNPFDRRCWSDGVLRWCEDNGAAFLPWSPVGGGRGQGEVRTDATLNAVGARHGASPFEVALAWLLAKSPAMIPIPGASKIRSARSSAAASDLALTPADMAELDRAFPT